MQKDSKIALLFCGFFIGILALSAVLRANNLENTVSSSVVHIEDGVQIIDLAAKGGFTPGLVEARADLPTELRITTNGTYDCSSSIVIPSLGYKKTLPATGIETIRISTDKATGTLEGTCGMGMYSFEIAFK